MQMPNDLKVLAQTELSFTVSLTVPASLTYLKGHFPVKQLLPGVVQVGWVCELTRELLLPKFELTAISQLKFTAPIMPEDQLLLQVQLSEDRHKLDFNYQLSLKDKLIPSSKGRLDCRESA